MEGTAQEMCQPMPKDMWHPVEFFSFLWLLYLTHTHTHKRYQIPYVFSCCTHGDTLLKEIYTQHLSPTCLWYSNYYLMYILLSILIAGSQQMGNMYSYKDRKLQFYTYKLKRDVCSAFCEKQGRISEMSFPNKLSCFKLFVFLTINYYLF